jgi:transposase
MSRRRDELTEREWLIIASLLPCKPRGIPRVDDRMVLNGILWRFRTGSHGPKSLSAMVLQRPATTVSFDGGVLVSGIDCWRPCLRPMTVIS